MFADLTSYLFAIFEASVILFIILFINPKYFFKSNVLHLVFLSVLSIYFFKFFGGELKYHVVLGLLIIVLVRMFYSRNITVSSYVGILAYVLNISLNIITALTLLLLFKSDQTSSILTINNTLAAVLLKFLYAIIFMFFYRIAVSLLKPKSKVFRGFNVLFFINIFSVIFFMYIMNVLLRFSVKNMENFELIEGLNVFTYYWIIFFYAIYVVLFYLYNSYILTHYKFKEIKFEAETDLMTGAFNRQTGMKILTSKIKKASMAESDFTIAYIDVNNLKKVNDKYGHNEGDELIKIVSESIKTTLRENDFVSRLGGDEFLVYLDNCCLDEGNKAWKRIQEKINATNFTMDKKYPISVSVGLADYRNNQSLNVKELLEKADSEMYKNKRAFKKRTT